MNHPKQNVHQPIRAGALTLLLTVVAVCLAILSVLALSTARADRAMAEKQMQMAQATARAEADGAAWLARVDAVLLAQPTLTAETAAALLAGSLPEGTTVDETGRIAALLPQTDGGSLAVALQVPGDAGARYTILQWQTQYSWTPEEKLNLWTGM